MPSWASENNLQANGLYFEGFVDDLEAVLDYHKVLTVSTYGTRKSRKGKFIKGKENETPSKQKHSQKHEKEVIFILY